MQKYANGLHHQVQWHDRQCFPYPFEVNPGHDAYVSKWKAEATRYNEEQL